jgi:predicted TIM-barrel fold metal-dependent hydrolase
MCERHSAVGGERAVEGYSYSMSSARINLAMPLNERQKQRVPQGAWWAWSTKNTRDRATAMMPRLLHQRMDEFGCDFSVLYPSAGLGLVVRIPDDELRRVTCRAFNTYCADYFGEYSDRMTPVTVISMHTPDEALEELEFSVKQLGLKAICMGSLIPSPDR